MLRFTSDGFAARVCGVLRFFVARVVCRQRFRAKGLSLVGRQTDILIRGSGSIEFQGRVILAGFNQLCSSGRLTIGGNVSINEYSRIVSRNQVTIGNNVTIARFVSILDHDHDWEMVAGNLRLNGYKSAPIYIGNNVLIGDKVSVLKGVTIGDNVVLAANSVVVKDVPSNCIAGGVPAKVIRAL